VQRLAGNGFVRSTNRFGCAGLYGSSGPHQVLPLRSSSIAQRQADIAYGEAFETFEKGIKVRYAANLMTLPKRCRRVGPCYVTEMT